MFYEVLHKNQFPSGFGRTLNEDSVSKLKKERAKSVAGAATEHKLGGFGASVGEGNRVGADNCPHTPDNLSKDRGWRISKSLVMSQGYPK